MIVDPKELTIIGATNFRSMRKNFGIKRDDRRRHVYVIGKSGSGKSALLENMIMQDIINGNGCCVMDPHGDLAEAIVKCIPPERQNDVVYFNPSDVDYPVAFNILEGTGSDSNKNLVTSGLIGIFKKIWADSWGPRLEYVLRNTILSLMYAEGSTLLGINRMLTDKKYRNSVLENVHDPILKAFWTQEYENYPAKELPMIVSPIQNKVGQFLSNPIVRNILGQAHSTIDLREIMDKKKIFLVNLSKGRIGEDNSSLIGSMIVTKLYLAAMSRVNLPEEQRNDFYLYVDEFQNFATDSFADILSEARKYRLSLIVAHQYVLQLPEKVSDAIFGNGGTLVTFRLGSQDAEIFEKEFGPEFVLEDLVNIPKYNIVLKLLIDGVASKPFSASTLPPMTKNSTYEDRSSIIINESRKKYSMSRELVEEQIRNWSLTEEEKRILNKQKKENDSGVDTKNINIEENKEVYTTNCWVCGMKIEVPFKPDNKRPIYCVDDLKKIREKLIEEPKENRFVKKENVSHNNQNQKDTKSNQQNQRSQQQNQNIKKDNNLNQQNNISKNNQKNKSQEIKKEELKPIIKKVEVKPVIKTEELKSVIKTEEVNLENDFKSILGDIMKETGIEIKNNKRETVEEIKAIKEPQKLEEIEPKKEEILIEPIKEILKIEEPEEIPFISEESSKSVLSLNQLKEKSFEEIKEALNQDKKNSNQPNVLKAGEVIKL